MHFLTLANGQVINMDHVLMVETTPTSLLLFTAFGGQPPYNVTDSKDVDRVKKIIEKNPAI
jgi:hypothetical protein